MKLEEAAESILVTGMVNNREIKVAFIAGYRHLENEILSFLRANPKATASQIIQFIETE